MRTHKPIDLVTELIRSGEPVTRGNATVALSALGTAESTSMLVGVALTDKDADIRARAHQELRLLGSKSESGFKNVTAAIHDRLGNEESRVAAYVLLGQLRNLGLPIPLPKMTLPERMSLAARSRIGVAPTSYYRPIALGTVVGSALMLLFAGLVEPLGTDSSELIPLLLFGSCAAPLVTVFAFSRIWRWQPVTLETDYLGAMLADSRLALVGGSLMGLLVLVVSLLANSRATLKFAWEPIVSGIILIAAVRVGCALSFGTFRQRTLDYAFGMVSGTASGIAVITLLQLAFRSYNDPVAATSWLMLAPISAGLAAAIAGVDHREKAVGSNPFGRTANMAMAALSAVVALCATLAAWPSPHPDVSPAARAVAPRPSCVVPLPAANPQASLKVPLTPGVGTVCVLQIGQPAQVLISANHDAVAHFTFNLVGPTNLSEGPPFVGLVLTSGVYTLQVNNIYVPPPPRSTLLEQAGQRLVQRFRRGSGSTPVAPNPALEITLTSISKATDIKGTDQQLNQWCWTGSVKGFASSPGVRQACEDAVTESKNDPAVRDSRGLNRALNGDYPGAIADFTAFAQQTPDRLRAAERLKWINQLKKNQNPFTPAELSRIVNE